ncbi:hypothetical protein [Paenibacillus sp. OV219]|uniref:hypothetical protein n=1 Tax=Paenibacillus sp. OV219 TaxID=1884377 RepID=UPI0008B9F42A|nr:hypothetical protein [Paenibacillus sp. OV219]SEP16917.1 hypothetical protein SAMN05518847_1242 [Paenibacillus sp. OV219]
MPNEQNEVSKADVQSVKLNKLPVAGAADTEFSAEEAAEVFQHNPAANETAANESAKEALDEF